MGTVIHCDELSYLALGGEEVVVDVVGEVAHLLEARDGAVLEHLVEDVVAALVGLLVGHAGLLEQVEIDEAAGKLAHLVEVDPDELSLLDLVLKNKSR